MDNLDTIIHVVLAAIFIVGPFLFRLFAKGAKIAKMTVEQLEKKSSAPPKNIVAPQRAKEVRARSTVKQMERRKHAAPKEAGLSKLADVTLATLELQKERSKIMETTCSYRDFAVLSALIARYTATLVKQIEHLRQLKDEQQLTRNSLDEVVELVNVIEARLVFFDTLVTGRGSSHTQYYNCADVLIQNMLAPYTAKMRHQKFIYSVVAAAVMESSQSGGGLHGVPLAHETIVTPRLWPQISFTLAHTIFEIGKFGTKTSSDLGLPSAITSMSFFLSSGRLMSAGLVSSWMPWIFADVAASLQLGISHGWTLLEECEKTSSNELLTRFRVDKRGAVRAMPLLSRLMVVSTVLQRMSVFDMQEFGMRFDKLCSQYPEISIDVDGRASIPMQASALEGDLQQVAISLIGTPLSVLGDFSLDEVVGTDFSPPRMQQYMDFVDRIRKGKGLFNVSAADVAVVIALALNRERNAEGRIASAALKTLSQVTGRTVRKGARTADAKRNVPTELADVFSSTHLPNTVRIGAISKARGGISLRR